MVFGRGRAGRPGLLGTVARTAVIAGTANATSNAMNRRRQARDEQQQDAQSYREQQAPPVEQAPVAAAPEDDLVTKIQKLADLRQQGMLDDAEFAAAKAALLG